MVYLGDDVPLGNADEQGTSGSSWGVSVLGTSGRRGHASKLSHEQ